MKQASLYLIFALSCATSAQAQTNWTNGGGDSSWRNPANWSNGIPSLSNSPIIATQPSANLIGIDTGNMTNVVPQFSFGAGLSGSTQVVNAGVEQLTVLSGGIVNASSFAQTFNVFVQADAAASVTTGGGLSFAGGLEVAAPLSISGSGAFTLSLTASTVFVLQQSSFGSLSSSSLLNYNSGKLVLDVTGARSPGSSFTLVDAASRSGSLGSVAFAGGDYTGSLSRNASGLWTGTAGGLSWQFSETTGVLTAVPEPSSMALLASCAAPFLLRRRRGSL
jgi:hypothetical protein